MKVSLLGLDFGASDAAILGSGSLFILTLWFLYSIRRENHLIGSLLIDADKSNDKDKRLIVFHGIASYLVFTTIAKHDEPIDSLTQPPARLHSIFYLRSTFVALLFLPVIAIVFVLATDLWSLIKPAAVRDPGKRLYELLSWYEWFQVAYSDGIALALGVTTGHLCNRIWKFERASGDILREFHQKYIADRPGVAGVGVA